jgi:glutaredoxin
MKKKLELYYFPECPYCQIVLSAIKENHLQSDVTLLNTRENSSYREKLVKDTGRGTVPCLYIEGRPMHESRDIAHWLNQYAKEKNNGN